MVNFSIQKGLDAARCKVQYFKHNDMKDLEAILMKQDELDKKVYIIIGIVRLLIMVYYYYFRIQRKL